MTFKRRQFLLFRSYALVYNDGDEKIGAVFERPCQPLLKQGVKVHAYLGNHDIRTANGDPQVSYACFNMQGRYYIR